MTSVQERVAERTDPSPNPAIARLRAALSSGREAEEAYVKWRNHSLTRMFIDALEELADSPPVYRERSTDVHGVLLQHGMTDGLQLAVRLIKQPYRVYPDVFKGGAPDVPEDDFLERAYEDTPDSVLDSMMNGEQP